MRNSYKEALKKAAKSLKLKYQSTGELKTEVIPDRIINGSTEATPLAKTTKGQTVKVK